MVSDDIYFDGERVLNIGLSQLPFFRMLMMDIASMKNWRTTEEEDREEFTGTRRGVLVAG